MVTVFVSGCFDIVHAGHVRFLTDARRLGDRLVVCVPSDRVARLHRDRALALTVEHKSAVLGAMACVDEIVVGDDLVTGINFSTVWDRVRPALLVATEDDRFRAEKEAFCRRRGARYVQLPKVAVEPPLSATSLSRRLSAPRRVPLRVDFAGGWLDVPRFAVEGGFVVNCTIELFATRDRWPCEYGGGLGGSAARAVLDGEDSVHRELESGVGWQDPAVILETGLCVWASGPRPQLVLKRDPMELLRGRMAITWTGEPHDTPSLAEHPRDYDRIVEASRLAASGVELGSFQSLVEAVRLSYEVQRREGMERIPDEAQPAAVKYLGGGWGGYVLHLFLLRESRDAFVSVRDEARAVEPYLRTVESSVQYRSSDYSHSLD